MEAQLKQSYVKEVKYQTKMLNNLKRWLRNFIIFSSLSLVLVVSGPSIHPLLRPIGIFLMILAVIGCVVIGLGIKNGKDNIDKIIDILEQ